MAHYATHRSPLLLSPVTGLVIFTTAFVACFALWLSVPEDRLIELLREGGPIETATAVFYVLAAALMLLLPASLRFRSVAALLVLLLAARELDLHRAFTTDSVLKLPYYTRDYVPLPEKIVSALVLLVLAIILVRFALRYWKPFLNAVRTGVPAARTLLMALVLLPVSKSFETVPRILMDDFGLPGPSPATGIALQSFEEGLELAIPLLLMLSAVQMMAERPRARRASNLK